MSITKRALLALGGTFAFATAARAQSQGSNQAPDALLDQQAVYIDSTGKMSRLTLNGAGDAAMKKYGQPVEGPAIVYRKDGKHYAVHDQKMSDGNTLLSQMDSWTSNRQAVGTM
jgi:hypothetical protein